MKKYNFVILLFSLITLLACNTNPNRPDNFNKVENGMADKANYSCPMHPEVLSDQPGDCPKCGMKLVKVDKEKNDSLNVRDSV